MKKCEICGKGSRMVGSRKLLRGHYNPTNRTRKYPNLQKTATPKGEKVFACTTCIRTFSKEARMAANKERRARIRAQKEADTIRRMADRTEKRKATQTKKEKARKAESSKNKVKPKKEAKGK